MLTLKKAAQNIVLAANLADQFGLIPWHETAKPFDSPAKGRVLGKKRL